MTQDPKIDAPATATGGTTVTIVVTDATTVQVNGPGGNTTLPVGPDGKVSIKAGKHPNAAYATIEIITTS